jgi:hypothetical protein
MQAANSNHKQTEGVPMQTKVLTRTYATNHIRSRPQQMRTSNSTERELLWLHDCGTIAV